MNMRMNGSTVFLDRWQTLELIDAAGAIASVKSGCLWITMENDGRDIVLGTGESWTIDRDGRTLVHAEKPSTVRLTETKPAKLPWMARTRGFLAAMRLWWSEPVRRATMPYY